MSTAAVPRAGHVHVLRYFVASRGLEVAVLQASPLLGLWFAGLDLANDHIAQLLLMLLGSVALTAHVFVVNDWAGYDGDARDPSRASRSPHGAGIGRVQVAFMAGGLLLLAAVALSGVGRSALTYGAGIAALGLVYSLAPRYGKSTPGAASLNHLAGGVLHFLMGYTVLRPADPRGVVLGVFFGLVFAGGHLNQEVRDHAADRAGGVRTSAVVFGPRRILATSFGLFSVAYALIATLAALGLLPHLLLVIVLLWVAQAAWTVEALRRGLNQDTALWLRRRYRLLFALVGLLMLVA